MNRILLIIALIVLGIVTVLAFLVDGITGFPTAITNSYASLQIYLDLVIAILLIDVWIWHDAKAHNRNPVPWIVASLIVGCFSPLAYLLTRKTDKV